MSIRSIRPLFFLIAVCLLASCSQTSAIEIGETAPDFKLADINGKNMSLSEFKGKVIILDFFASWCPPCKMEIPDFIQLQTAYREKGFSVVGVALVDKNEAKDFAEKMGINYPILVDDNSASTIYGPIRSIPTTFVIDKEFTIRRIYIGYRSKDVFEKDVQELLK